MAALTPEQKALIRQEVANSLRNLASLLESDSAKKDPFLPAPEAIARMGLSITPKQLAAHVRKGWLRSGKEYVDVGTGGRRPTYRYNPTACRDRLAIPAERRHMKAV